MDLDQLNAADPAKARARFLDCCASTTWADAMTARRPFADVDALATAAADTWWALSEADWLEAFAAHPRIGELGTGHGRFAEWSRDEQAEADPLVAAGLVDANRAYEDRFGHVFLVFATGKTAPELLGLCRTRLEHDPDTELAVCAAEQAKITDLRLRRLLGIV